MAASPTWAATDSSVAARNALLINELLINELLIYDGDCGFCTTSATWYSRIAGDSSRIAAWQSLDLDDYGLTSEQTSESVWWYSRGQTSGGADACADALQACRWPWKGLGFALAFAPVRWAARLVYPVIARNRHKLPGATAACEWQPPSS